MEKLYIIGNGFDIHHDIKTSYWHFSEFLKKNRREIFDLLENFISYPIDEENLWANFEQNLAYLNTDEILSENSDCLPNFSSDDFQDRDWHTFTYVMTDITNLLTEDLLESFRNFILSVEIPKSAFRKKIVLDSKSVFLNFNYTNSLEKIYGINPKSINYIHECANSECDYIILGHGIDPKQFEEDLPEPPQNLESEEYNDWYENNQPPYDYPFSEGKASIMRYFEIMHKPTSKIIEENKLFFNKLNSIKTIFVFGHSMSKVDLPYFKKIVDSTKDDIKWVVSYYDYESIANYEKVFDKLGVDNANVKMIKLASIQLDNTQLSLDLK